MKKRELFGVFAIIAVFLTIFAVRRFSFEPTTINRLELDLLNDDERQELSECIANIFWTNLSNYYPYYDIKIILARLEELAKIHANPMNPLECRMTYLLPLLDKINAYEAARNLKAAKHFLANLSGKEGVVEIVKSKLYYEQLQRGEGSIITRDDSPIIHYEESILDHLTPQCLRQGNITRIRFKDLLKEWKECALANEGKSMCIPI